MSGDYLDGLAEECRPLTAIQADHFHQRVTRPKYISHGNLSSCQRNFYLLFLPLRGALDAIATLDHVGFEAYRSGRPM